MADINYKIAKYEDVTALQDEFATYKDSNILKVAKVEKALSDYQKTLSQVNVNQEAKQTANGYGIVSLPKNAANGQVSVTVRGRTRTNLLGNVGDCENISEWARLGTNSEDATIKLYGTKSFKFTSSTSQSNVYKDFVGLDNAKYYIVIGSALIQSYTSGNVAINIFDSGAWSNLIQQNFSTTLLNQWQHRVIKFTGRTGIRVQIGSTITSTLTANMDGIILQEVTQAEYNSITNGDASSLIATLGFINNTKSTVGASRLKSVGKNLFDGEMEEGRYNATNGLKESAPGNVRSKNFTKIKPNTLYSISQKGALKYVNLRYYDENKIFIKNDTAFTFLTPANCCYITFYYSTGFEDTESIQLEEGTVATPYEPYTESIAYIPNVGELRSLPNGTKDEVNVIRGVKTQRINAITINGSESWLYGGDDGEYWRFANTTIQNRNQFSKQNSNRHVLIINSNIPFQVVTYAGLAGDGEKIAFVVDGSTYVKISKTRLPEGTVNAFENWLATNQITLTYQLATPVETPIQVSGTLLSNPSGTVYVEPFVADAGVYSDGVSVLHEDLPIKALEKISKVDFDTGLETKLDITAAVIAEDKLSFTHPDLTSGDIVFFVYEHGAEGTIPETEISYYDSRYVIKGEDDKFYRWEIEAKLVEGVITPSIKLVEV